MSDETLTNIPDGGDSAPDQTQKLSPISPAPSFDQDLSGTTLAGYKLVQKLAAGGMGVVYEAIQTKLDRKVALKVLTDQLGSRPEFLQRFEREAKAAAALSHPNMVQVYDYGEVSGRHYIIMEYIEGLNLSDYIEQHGKLSLDHALSLVEQAAHALKAAAEKSIIHRDVKPSNLLLTSDGRIKVADLGLAKILTQDSELTLSNMGIGSPHFIAPEQADDSRHSDHRADIYSLGVTLLFLLTGKHAYDGNSPISLVLAHTTKPLPTGAELGTELPEEVETLIHRMAAKDPNDRYQDYQSLLLDLQRVRAGFSPTAMVGKKPLRRSQWILAASIAGCVILVAVASVIATRPKPKPVVKTDVVALQAADSPQVIVTPPANRPMRPRRLEAQDGPLRRGGPDEGGQFEPRGEGGPVGIRWPVGPPNRVFYDIPEGSPAAMLAAADAYAAEHKENYAEVIDCYRQVQRTATGTPSEREAEKRLQDWTKREQAALKAAVETREAKMQALVREGKPQQAFDLWSDFPEGLRSREVDDQIRALLLKRLPPGFQPNDAPGADK